MDTLAARQQMVDQQIRTWEVLDPRVLDALLEVLARPSFPSLSGPRFRRLAAPHRSGQSMLAPKIQGRILQALGMDTPTARSRSVPAAGYLCACLSLLSASTHSMDIHADFTAVAAANLRAVPQARVQLETRDAFDAAPLGEYDAIALTGSCRFTTRASSAALRPGGRCSLSSDSLPSWTPCSCAESIIGNGFARACSRRSIDSLVNATAAQGFVF